MAELMEVDRNEPEVASRHLRRAVIGTMTFATLAMMLATMIPQTWPLWLTFRLLIQQDAWLLAAQLVLAAAVLQPFWGNAILPELSGWRLGAAMSCVVLGCYAGFYWVLGGYDITRDEQMAAFDSWVFAQGHLVWPIPPEWQPDAAALNTLFMLPVEHPTAWISAYLPGNAILRALVGMIADPAFTGPLVTAATLPALLACSRKIWPDERQIAAICVWLLLGSGQVLLMGMSSYAMPAHLLCNLIWLRLFLANKRQTDFAALAVGALATGLHQPLFHPLFVAPFLLILLLERNWARLAMLSLGYLAIGLGWMAWPGFVQGLVVGQQSVTAATGTDYVTRLLDSLAANSDHAALMAANLLRFVTWQHLLLIPLLVLGTWVARRDRLAVALALGIGLTTVAMAAILPWQGNGFGYRYLHGLIGNAILLAGFGWRWLNVRLEGLGPAFARATLATLLVLVPLQMWFSYQRYAPFAAADRKMAAAGTDYFILQAGNGFSFGSLVLNKPDLSNRPVRLMAEYVPDHARLAQRICRPGVSVAMAGNGFFRAGAAYFRTKPQDTAGARLPALRAPYEQAGCRIVIVN